MSKKSKAEKSQKLWNKVFNKEYYRLSGLGLSHILSRSVAGSIATGEIWRINADKRGG
jgi:hypothetical protein